jgi:AcrR family transcriptional regulator
MQAGFCFQRHFESNKEIAAEAELSPGTLYIYFKNKDELYSALSIPMLKHLSLGLQRVKERKELWPEQRITAVKEAICEAYEIDAPVFITLSLCLIETHFGCGLISSKQEARHGRE